MMEVDEFEINDFPDEILLEILGFLDFEALKNSTLVCRKWNEIIGLSPKLMKNFVLNLFAARVGKLDKRFCSRRKHINVFIHFENEEDKLLDVVKQFDVSQARRISFHRYQSSIHIKRVRKVLAKMPLLEDASLMFNKVEVPKRAKISPLKLENFKRVRLFPYACNALKLFNPKKIVELRIEESPITDETEKLVDFLHETINLNILRVSKTAFNAIFEHEHNFSFQLQKLDMLYHNTTVADVACVNFDKFLRSQASSLKVLDLSGLEGLSKVVHETVLGRLKTLAKLTIDGSFLPNYKEFYQKLRKNNSLKSLVLLKGFSSDDAAKGILGISHEMNDLDLNFSISTKINFIASHNPKLKHLTCTTIHRSITKGLNFNYLNSLTVLHIVDVDHWLSIVKNSPQLQKLIVLWVDGQITEEVVDILLQQPSLSHLKLSGTHNNMTLIFNKLKLNHGNLRSFDFAIKDRCPAHPMAKLTFEFTDELRTRNFSQEHEMLAECEWKKVSSEPRKCNSVNDVVKFKFETKMLTMVDPFEVIAL